ncbi:dihydropteroate synthase [Microvirga calopogonii]|uniref:dihydropteroate synthase n=1 Tax=Microvirga calopogonii TaxID=2078013 RepID=UPI003CCB1B0F
MTAILKELGTRTLIIGVLNVTPDSFSDGRLFRDYATAVKHAREMELGLCDRWRPNHQPPTFCPWTLYLGECRVLTQAR